ncbi:MAG TPA: dihydrofolate reductase family protein [Candidatus Saccharimonadales bacterium]|nr:dihydrofolate reductase family protein [Candidatus Saccharimonadales bacterium]
MFRRDHPRPGAVAAIEGPTSADWAPRRHHGPPHRSIARLRMLYTCSTDEPREFLKAGLVDRLHVAIVPILLGRGIRLWDDLRGLQDGYGVTSEVASSGTTHLTFSR